MGGFPHYLERRVPQSWWRASPEPSPKRLPYSSLRSYHAAMSSSIEEATTEFVLAHDEFELDELVAAVHAAVPSAGANLSQRLGEILGSSGGVFTDNGVHFISRKSYFRDARLIISPTEDELADGAVVPGHRFVPFVDPGIAPLECSLVDETGRQVDLVKVDRLLSELRRCCVLLGWDDFPYYLNYDGIEPPTEVDDSWMQREVSASAFELSRFIKPGGSPAARSSGLGEAEPMLEIRLIDWEKGRFSVRRLSDEEAAERRAGEKEWIEAMDAGLAQALELLGPHAPVPEQLAWAYYLEGRLLRLAPPFSIGTYLSRSERISVQMTELGSTLWYRGEEAAAISPFENIPEGPRGDDESLDAILRDVGISLSANAVEGLMRNELYSGHEEIERVYARAFGGRMIEFANETQRTTFFDFLSELWEETRSSYDRSNDERSGVLRARVVEMYGELLRWLRGLDSRGIILEKLPHGELLELTKASGFLDETLRLLNDPEELEEETARDFATSLDRLQEVIQDLISRVEAKIASAEQPKEGGPRERRERDRFAKLFTLKVSLEDIHPPIWRRIRINGDATLEELHEIIQIVMGWEGYHLHGFTIAGSRYSPAAEDSGPADSMFAPEGMREEEESTVRIDEVLTRVKARGRYTYDFGDGWEHLIVVEKIDPPDANGDASSATPVCLAGKRAAPPEDCGGLPGYYRVLAALQGEGDSAPPELLEWIGDFDPDRVDLEEINAALEEAFG